MKITGGQFRGRTIESERERSLRPTTSKIREVMFNLLQHGKFRYADGFIDDGSHSLVLNKRVVDIFCGTGALGVEALSRGATHATFIDQNARTLELVRKTLTPLVNEDDYDIIRSDSTQLPRAFKPCDLAFIDPPYGEGLSAKALKSLAANGWLKHGSVIVLEQSSKSSVVLPEGYHLCDERMHDKTKLSILQFREAA